MENAVDALKLAFAVFVFVIALALTFSVVGQARATSDTVLALNDKTNLYDYVNESENNAKGKDRIVGFETILPTIYRYAKEQYAVTILDESGTPIVRYDLYTEGFMQNWNTLLKQANKNIGNAKNRILEIQDRISRVDEKIQDETGKKSAIWDSMVSVSEWSYTAGKLYEGRSKSNSTINTVAQWVGSDDEIKKRIICDLSGSNAIYEKNDLIYYGKKLDQYEDRKFKEIFLEIQTTGTTITTEAEGNIEYSLETVKGNKKLEIIYILQP